MDRRYNIGQLIEAAFGIKNPYMVHPVEVGRADNSIQYTGVKTIAVEEAVKYSSFGTPVVFPIMFKGGEYEVYDSNGRIRLKEFKDFELPAATLLNFNRAKNIIKTPILGNNGTVKEIYGFDDWQITMRGIVLPEKDKTVEDIKKELLRWEGIAGSIEVEGALFDEKGIRAISIEEIDLSQIQGKPKMCPFEFSAVSDEAIELVLKKRGVIDVGELEIESIG